MAKTRSAERWMVLGTAGSGKSYWSKRFVDGLAGETVLVWDPESEWAGPDADKGIRNATTFRGVGDLTAWIAKHNPRLDGRRLVIQGGGAAQFEELGRLAYRAGDLWVVVDEAHSWCSSTACPKAWLDLVQRCRHRRVSLLFVSQRPAGLSPAIRYVKSKVVLFQLPDRASREWVRNEVAEGLAERLRTLKPREYVTWQGGDTWAENSSRQRGSRSRRPTARTSPTTGLASAEDSPTELPTSTPASSSRRSSRSR